MNICEKCGDHCKCQLVELHLPHDLPIPSYEDRIKSLYKELQKNQIKVNKLDRFKKPECHKTGCRSLETRCQDCGRVVDSAEILTNQGNSGWIDREVKFPDADNILCCAGNDVFICELIESKCGDFYYSTDTEHIEFQNMPQWTHWMPLPEPPRERGDGAL